MIAEFLKDPPSSSAQRLNLRDGGKKERINGNAAEVHALSCLLFAALLCSTCSSAPPSVKQAHKPAALFIL